jgi:hypothetical protein
VNYFLGRALPTLREGTCALNDDDDMPRARPQFVDLSEAEVWEAIAGDAGGAVEAEVTRLALVANFYIPANELRRAGERRPACEEHKQARSRNREPHCGLIPGRPGERWL